MRRGWRPAVLAAAAVAVLLAACSEPVPAPSTPVAILPDGALVARTALKGPVREADDRPGPGPVGAVDQSCPPSIRRPAGRMDFCYQTWRVASPTPGKDRYLIRTYGSIIGEEGSGVSIWLARIRPIGDAPTSVVATWPHGINTGPCRVVVPDLPLDGFALEPDEICGMTTVTVGGSGAADGETIIAWRCPDCPPPRRSTIGITLYVLAEVPDGAIPTWEIRADVAG